MMVFLTQNETSFDYIPFASTLIFELKHSDQCLKTGLTNSCYGVSVMFNGESLFFDECTGDGFSDDGSGCTFDEFDSYMKKIWYSGLFSEDLDKACEQE